MVVAGVGFVLVSVFSLYAVAGDGLPCDFGNFTRCNCVSDAKKRIVSSIDCFQLHLVVLPLAGPAAPAVSSGFTYNMSHNLIETVRSESFKWLSGSRIQALDLSSNRIRFIDAGAFAGMIITSLDLSNNIITSLSYEAFANFSFDAAIFNNNWLSDPCNFTRDASSISRSWLIDLRMNRIAQLSSQCFSSSKPVSLSVDLSHNNLIAFNEDTLLHSDPVRFDVGSNLLSDDMLGSITKMFSKRQVDASRCSLVLTNNTITRIDLLCNSSLALDYVLDFNKIQSIPAGCSSVLSQDNGTVARLVNNALVEIRGSLTQGLRSVTNMQLFGNALISISPDAFKNVTQLLQLNLSLNRLGSVDDSFFDAVCSDLQRIRELDLSYNSIKIIPASCFATYKELSALFLAGNRLITISKESFPPNVMVLELQHNNISDVLPGTFIKLHSLQKVDISFNSLTHLSETDYNCSMEYFYFSGNPFACSCKLLSQLMRIKANTDIRSATCMDAKQLVQSMNDFDVDTCILPLLSTVAPAAPSVSEAQVVGIVIAVALLLLGAVGGTCVAVRRRWRYSRAAGYNAEDDGNPSFADTQGYKFTTKMDKLQLLST